MKPKKNLIEAAEADGSIARMNQLLSAVQILLCEAKNLSDEASELMAEKGLLIGDIKKLHKDFERCADKYFKEFATLVETEKSKMDMFEDLEAFDKAFRKWAKVPNDWKQKEESVYFVETNPLPVYGREELENMEVAVGETFRYRDDKSQMPLEMTCVERDSTECDGCFFSKMEDCTMRCGCGERKDNKTVFFVRKERII